MKLLPAVAAGALGLALSACSGSSTPTAVASSAAPAPSPAATDPLVESSPLAPSAPSSPSASTPASGRPGSPSVAPAGHASAAGAPRCTTAHLALSVGDSEGAAGSTVTTLLLRNAGTSTCHLTGFPGVSFLDGDGRQLGVPADMTSAARTRVELAPGASASAQLRVSNAGNYDDSACRPRHARRVRVYPPGDRTPLTTAFEVDVCTATTLHQSSVEPVRPASGPAS